MSEEETTDAAARLAAKKAARAEAWAKLQADEIELEDKYDGELGPRGSEFEIVLPTNAAQVADGLVVVKKPERQKWAAFQESKMSATDAHHLVIACLADPADKERFNELAKSRPMIVSRCATAIAKLVGLELQAEAGK
jgi:hypothetical protein